MPGWSEGEKWPGWESPWAEEESGVTESKNDPTHAEPGVGFSTGRNTACGPEPCRRQCPGRPPRAHRGHGSSGKGSLKVSMLFSNSQMEFCQSSNSENQF